MHLTDRGQPIARGAWATAHRSNLLTVVQYNPREFGFLIIILCPLFARCWHKLLVIVTRSSRVFV